MLFRSDDGTELAGESRISAAGKRIRRVQLDPPDVKPLPAALEAIREADAILIGPGSLYTSVLPPLLVPGLAETLRASPAPKIYICNVMTQPGETDGYAASHHVRALLDHLGRGCIDYVVVNDQPVSREQALRYREQGAYPVQPDVERIRRLGIQVVARPLIHETVLVRHDPARLAATVMEVVFAHRASRDGKRIADFYLNGFAPRWRRAGAGRRPGEAAAGAGNAGAGKM